MITYPLQKRDPRRKRLDTNRPLGESLRAELLRLIDVVLECHPYGRVGLDGKEWAGAYPLRIFACARWGLSLSPKLGPLVGHLTYQTLTGVWLFQAKDWVA